MTLTRQLVRYQNDGIPNGMGTTSPANTNDMLNASTVPGITLTDALNALFGGAAVASPFRTQYFVDAAFVGISNGSAGNPFTSIAAAFAAAAAAGLSGAIIYLPDKVNHVENVVFPDGGDWELASVGKGRTTLTGTVDVTSTLALGIRRLTNLSITGAVSGQATPASCFLFSYNTVLQSTLTLTQAGAGFWRTIFDGQATSAIALGGAVLGATDIQGELYAAAYSWAAVTAGIIQGSGCTFGTAVTFSNSTRTGVFRDCLFPGGCTFTGSGGAASVVADGFTVARLLQSGLALVATTFAGNNAQLSVSLTVNADVAAVEINGAAGAHEPAGLYTAIATLYLTTPGTAGTAVVNVIYTDLGGVVRTLPVTPGLAVNGAAGLEDRGAPLPFAHNGATSIQYSVTGVTTPGAFAAELRLVLRKED